MQFDPEFEEVGRLAAEKTVMFWRIAEGILQDPDAEDHRRLLDEAAVANLQGDQRRLLRNADELLAVWAQLSDAKNTAAASITNALIFIEAYTWMAEGRRAFDRAYEDFRKYKGLE